MMQVLVAIWSAAEAADDESRWSGTEWKVEVSAAAAAAAVVLSAVAVAAAAADSSSDGGKESQTKALVLRLRRVPSKDLARIDGRKICPVPTRASACRRSCERWQPGSVDGLQLQLQGKEGEW